MSGQLGLRNLPVRQPAAKGGEFSNLSNLALNTPILQGILLISLHNHYLLSICHELSWWPWKQWRDRLFQAEIQGNRILSHMHSIAINLHATSTLYGGH